jgi:hypothetical protein
MKRTILLLISLGISYLGCSQIPTDGDYRTRETGNWDGVTTWQIRSGTLWSNTSSPPISANNIYVQNGHTLTVNVLTAMCNDFQCNTSGAVIIGGNTLEVYGKLRAYTGTSVITEGADDTFYSGQLSTTSLNGSFLTSTTGKLSIVGNTRNLTNSGEWGAASTGIAMEINLNSGQTATLGTGAKAKTWEMVSGTFDAATFTVSADNGTTGGTITVGNNAIFKSTASAGTYVIQRTGTTRVTSFTVNGQLILGGGSPRISADEVTFSGTVEYLRTGSQTLAVAVNSGASPNTYANLKISGSGTKTLGSDIFVTSTFTSVSGTTVSIPILMVLTINSNCQATLDGGLTNNAGSSGLVIEDGGSLITNGAVSGSATVKKVINADAKRHFISSPVSGKDICDGDFAPVSLNFNSTTGATYDFYKWSESAGNSNWLNLKTSLWALNIVDFGLVPQFGVGEGYLAAYGATFGGSSTKSFTGTLISGDQSITLGNTGNQWNLIGNPFASAINWDGVSKTNLVDGYYNVYNENKAGGAGYEYYLDASHKSSGANGNISIAQGFFVKATGSSLTIPNTARVHNNNWMKMMNTGPQNQLKFTLGNASNYDETFIQFESQGVIERDFFDAEKMFSMNPEIPQVYSIAENDMLLAFNSMPYNAESFSVAVGMYIPVDGDYWFKIEGIENFATAPEILFEDKKTGTTQNLNDNQIYQFNASANDDPDRFVLRFGPVGLSETAPEIKGIKVYIHDNQLYIMNAFSNFQVEIIDIQGHILQKFGMESNGSFNRHLNLHSGVYLIRLQNISIVKSVKVIVY